MKIKAFLKIRRHPSINHGSSTIEDIPNGCYESEIGPITVLEKIVDVDYGTYFNVKLDQEYDQMYNEFAVIYVQPKDIVLKPIEKEISLNYIKPDILLAQEVCQQWRLSNDNDLQQIAYQLEKWINKQSL